MPWFSVPWWTLPIEAAGPGVPPARTVERAAWEKLGGVTVATADPLGGKAPAEGTRTDRTSIGTLRVGKGRIVVFGALLPQPTESYDHWFGVDPYTISVAGQQLLLRALRWSDGPAARSCLDRRKFSFRLHHARRARVVRVKVYVNGKLRVTRRGRNIKRVTIKRLPKGRARVRIVATQSTGSKLVSTRTYRGCKKSRPRTRGIHRHR